MKPTCHPERRHRAHGLCDACYLYARRKHRETPEARSERLRRTALARWHKPEPVAPPRPTLAWSEWQDPNYLRARQQAERRLPKEPTAPGARTDQIRLTSGYAGIRLG